MFKARSGGAADGRAALPHRKFRVQDSEGKDSSKFVSTEVSNIDEEATRVMSKESKEMNVMQTV